MDSEEIIRLLSTSIYDRRFQFTCHWPITDEMVEEAERMWREEQGSPFDEAIEECQRRIDEMALDIDLMEIEREGRGKLLEASGAKKEADIKGLIKRWISRF